MMDVSTYISDFSKFLELDTELPPWQQIKNLKSTLQNLILGLPGDFVIVDEVAIHPTAVIEKGVTLKGPILIGENCFIAANAYLRGPVILDHDVKIGPGCEIKQSVIFAKTAIAHFNYIGDSIIGSEVNFEAGAIAANHYNERTHKEISVRLNGQNIHTGCIKFGALVGDNSKIGANAVLSPGTLLPKNSIVARLELVDQIGS